MNAIYATYFSGATGNSFAILVFLNGVVSGADAGLGRYDGSYAIKEGKIVGSLVFTLPPHASSITGISTENTPLHLDLTISLALPLEAEPFHQIETPLGPINARFEKLRDLDA